MGDTEKAVAVTDEERRVVESYREHWPFDGDHPLVAIIDRLTRQEPEEPQQPGGIPLTAAMAREVRDGQRRLYAELEASREATLDAVRRALVAEDPKEVQG